MHNISVHPIYLSLLFLVPHNRRFIFADHNWVPRDNSKAHNTHYASNSLLSFIANSKGFNAILASVFASPNALAVSEETAGADAERLGVEREGRPAPLLLCNINRRAQRGEDRHGGAAAKRHDVDATAPQVSTRAFLPLAEKCGHAAFFRSVCR
eukprot:scaffold328851_cov16-Prasinocladus_malaysianus.AAC.2